MLHLRSYATLFVLLAVIWSCKTSAPQSSESDEFYLPKVTEMSVRNDTLYATVRLNGNCKEHNLQWVEKEDCTFEIRDLTTDDRCLSFQFIEKQKYIPKLCNLLSLNGRSLSVK